MDETEISEDQDLAERLQALDALRMEHRHLDSEITAQQMTGVTDMLKIQRMKKLKLVLKDKIRVLEDDLTPDIIA
ncbi:YdcH family protein [Robiginitomaculum antarcticum]|uniref:YdcH family protein n=1 Tax=Robiginitomaculum antarcticum TaxID=437507 RepID=UPI000374BE08|nr:DUF465 domain-containing protein [Robiginitomaculum antarcticum]